MTVAITQMYNTGYDALITDGLTGTGEFMWVLVNTSYNPSPSDTDASKFNGNDITSGDGAPIAATNVEITDTPGNTAAENFFRAGSGLVAGQVKFGPDVAGQTITYRYLVLVRPATGGQYVSDATTKLIFYIDLTESGNDETAAGEYVTVNMAGNGWLKLVQA